MAIFQVGDLVWNTWTTDERTGVIVRLSSHGPYCQVLWSDGYLGQHEPLSELYVLQAKNREEVSDGD